MGNGATSQKQAVQPTEKSQPQQQPQQPPQRTPAQQPPAQQQQQQQQQQQRPPPQQQPPPEPQRATTQPKDVPSNIAWLLDVAARETPATAATGKQPEVESNQAAALAQRLLHDLNTALGQVIDMVKSGALSQASLCSSAVLLADALLKLEMAEQKKSGLLAKVASEKKASSGKTEDEIPEKEDDELEKHHAVPPHLGKVDVRQSTFAQQAQAASSEREEAAIPEALSKKKQVLMVIDVQDGYDGDFVEKLPEDAPGGLAYIQRRHPIKKSYELGKINDQKPGTELEPLEIFPVGQCMIAYDKVWNRGLDGDVFGRVCKRIVEEIKSSETQYDLVVFTYDYLEKSNGEEKGIFPLDKTPWTDPKKPIALVPYSEYLTFNAGGLGTDVSNRIRKELPDVTNARGPEGTVKSGDRQIPTLYFRKQVDDAFDDRRETGDRTLNEAWLDDVDVDDNGLPKPNAQSLLEKLKEKGFPPADTVLNFTGIVTNRCVASTLLHATIQHKYQTRLLEGGCGAASDAKHTAGVEMIREKGGVRVEIAA